MGVPASDAAGVRVAELLKQEELMSSQWSRGQQESLFLLLTMMQDALAGQQPGARLSYTEQQAQLSQLLSMLQQLIAGMGLDTPKLPAQDVQTQVAQLLALLQQLQQGQLGRSQALQLMAMLWQLMQQPELADASMYAAMDTESLAKLLLELLQQLGETGLSSAAAGRTELAEQLLAVLQQLLLQLMGGGGLLPGWQEQASQLALLLGGVAQQPPGGVQMEGMGSRQAQAEAMLQVLEQMQSPADSTAPSTTQSVSAANSQARLLLGLLQLVRQQDLGMVPGESAGSKRAQAAIMLAVLQQLGQQNTIAADRDSPGAPAAQPAVLSSLLQQLQLQNGNASGSAGESPTAAASAMGAQVDQWLLQALAGLPVPASLTKRSGTSVLAALQQQLRDHASSRWLAVPQAADLRAQAAIMMAALEGQAPQQLGATATSGKSAATSRDASQGAPLVLLMLLQQLSKMDLATIPRPALADRHTSIMLALESQLLDLAGRPQRVVPVVDDQEPPGNRSQPQLAGVAAAMQQRLMAAAADTSIADMVQATTSQIGRLAQQHLQKAVLAASGNGAVTADAAITVVAGV
jgi:hypothetical protein